MGGAKNALERHVLRPRVKCNEQRFKFRKFNRNSNCANRCRGAIEILHSVSRAVQSVRLFGPSVRNRIRVDAKFLNYFSCSAVIRDSCRCGKKEFCFVLGAVPFDRNDDRWTNQDAVLSGFGAHYGAFFDSERLRSLAGTITAPRLPTFADFKGDPLRMPEYQIA
jgi:hypothetical protein